MGVRQFSGQRPGRPAPGSRPTMRRWLLVTGALLVVALAAMAILYAVIRDDLPAQVASHWGSDGVDGTQAPQAYVLTLTAVLVGVVALQAALATFIPVEGRRGLGAVAAGLIGFLTLGLGGSLWDQRGLTDPYAAPSPGGWLALGFALAVPLAGLAWWLLPTHVSAVIGDTGEVRLPATAPRLDGSHAREIAATLDLRGAAPGVGRPWRDPIPPGRGNPVILVLLALFAVGMAVTPARWVAWGVILVIGAVIALMTRSELVVDGDGVRVQAYGRVTWLRAATRTIRYADVESVRPLRDFGGYGLRFGLRGRGFVTAPGPALHLSIPGGSDTWISCARPELAAAVVNEVLARHAG